MNNFLSYNLSFIEMSISKNGLLTYLLGLLLCTGCQKELPKYVDISYKELKNDIGYNIDVKPILSDKCYSCHGPDAHTRKSDLRFDTEEGLFSKSSNGNYAFTPGSLRKSETIARILTEDANFIMPPIESHLSLTPKEKAILVKWVEQGAEWKKHWAFIPPTKSKATEITIDWKPRNEIDQFVYDKLIENNLEPSKKTGKEQLLRRLTIDLTGLIPTVSELNSFLNDTSPNAYEKVVDRLLHTNAHAERLTTEWLDVARYSDSHGYHADGSRMMWPWRDWVIKAFQNNMSYKDFVTEQLAGDLMPNATKEQVLATAFNRNHPTTAEGGAIDEEFRVEYVTNRTNTFGTAFLGLTMECAKCHDHKFDPISQRNYFELFAFFNNIKELGMTANDGNAAPLMLLSDSITTKKIDRLSDQIDSLSNIEQEFKKKFVSNTNFKNSSEFMAEAPVLHHSFEKVTENKNSRYVDDEKKSTLSKGVEFKKGPYDLSPVFDSQYDQISIASLEPIELTDAFSVSIWISPKELPSPSKTMTIIGNSSVKHQFYKGWDLYIEPSGQISTRLINSLPGNYIHSKTNKSVPIGEWTHVLMTYDGSSNANGLNLYINGQKAIQEIVFNRLDQSIIPNAKGKLIVGKSPRGQTGDNGIFIGMIDELSIFNSEVLPLQAPLIYEQSKSKTPITSWTPKNETYTKLGSKISELRTIQHRIKDTIKEIMVMQEMPEQRKTYILDRGAYDSYGEEVQRSTPEKILSFDDKYPKNRLGLSQWLFDESNPLTARVTVNRYWSMIFGKGIIASANDFGNQGSLPSHPKLIDWLAVDFMESGWDVRALIRKMVVSKTYKQSSFTNEELRNIDPDNKLLARSPSYRYQAEFIRDNALKSSGLINEAIGGESGKPYQPKGLWIEKGNFSKALLYYIQDHDQNQYRKSMYTFNKRTSPPPYMEIFDMPGRENCTVSRERTNTPLQALSLLNDPQFVETSKALAVRMKNEGGKSIDEQIKMGYLLTLTREPNSKELQIMNDLYRDALEDFNTDHKSADKYLSVGDYKIPEKLIKNEIAAMTIVASTLYNLDEMYTKR